MSVRFTVRVCMESTSICTITRLLLGNITKRNDPKKITDTSEETLVSFDSIDKEIQYINTILCVLVILVIMCIPVLLKYCPINNIKFNKDAYIYTHTHTRYLCLSR
eukprot:GHVR01076083.1.p1 GENE.GHVR01076083.1~~GHVR01076083.1.p1  ORF type:complete len:106 (-),score=33.39 GHVR01076083.1:153-470(-)